MWTRRCLKDIITTLHWEFGSSFIDTQISTEIAWKSDQEKNLGLGYCLQVSTGIFYFIIKRELLLLGLTSYLLGPCECLKYLPQSVITTWKHSAEFYTVLTDLRCGSISQILVLVPLEMPLNCHSRRSRVSWRFPCHTFMRPVMFWNSSWWTACLLEGIFRGSKFPPLARYIFVSGSSVQVWLQTHHLEAQQNYSKDDMKRDLNVKLMCYRVIGDFWGYAKKIWL